MRDMAADRPLARWQQVGLGLLVLGLGVLGSMVVMRSSLMTRRMGDYDCFARAGWAVRTGHNMYDVTDDNGFHYNYPPLFAILMAPLADPPRGMPANGMVSYPVSVGIWYLVSLLLLAVGTHWLASALEEKAAKATLRQPRREGRRWWALRLIPILACAVPIGHTLMRGQANFILLICFCGLAACTLRGQSWRAGLCLA
ncbi:MAG TPA: glycosyltransferase family 87 protein, partial [Gemmataceae bacterium]|nr:glycosyltransferase family 87 protein [Gemmataceae bacterium]